MTEQTETGAPESVETASAVETPETPKSFNEAVDATMSAVWDKMNPPRAPDGTFAAKTQAETAPEGAIGETETPDTATAKPAGSDKLAPPEGWSDAAKVDWNRLPRTVQEEILNRAGHSAPDPATAEQVKRWEPVAQLFEPKRAFLQQRGWTEADAIRHLMAASDALDRDAPAAIKWLAQSYNVDLKSLVGEAETTDYVDPQIAKLNETINSLQQRLSQYETRQHQTELTEAQRAIEAFKSEKDEQGNPKRPHFDAVREEMHRLMKAGAAADLADAYDKAVWSNPQIRERILSEQRKAEEEKARKEAEKKAAEARKIKSINVKPGPGTTPTPKRTIEETMSEVYDRMTAA